MTMSMYSSYTPEDFNNEDDIFGKFCGVSFFSIYLIKLDDVKTPFAQELLWKILNIAQVIHKNCGGSKLLSHQTKLNSNSLLVNF